MKSIALKRKTSIPIKKYIGLYLFLFIVALLAFLDHYNESPLDVERLQASEGLGQGRSSAVYPAPDFTLRNLNGNWDSLSNYKGQVVILNIWATWCGPCRIEMPSLESLYRRFRSEGVAVLAVSIDKGSDEKVRSFAREYQLSFPVLLDADGQVERLFPTPSIPATYVIDKAGQVIAKVDGAKNWESPETFGAVEYLLKPS
ncbi:MAG: TlpA family protein disulfide reductase [Nitrospinae bacterium]|nr:TlpA family protein disulfide reductase [Nitrospinota bacterium]